MLMKLTPKDPILMTSQSKGAFINDVTPDNSSDHKIKIWKNFLSQVKPLKSFLIFSRYVF